MSPHIIGGPKDLQGGQYVDRIGVAMSLPFPAGKHLEALALQTTEYEPLPSSVKEGWISFAGPCSAAMRRISNSMNDIEKSNLSRARIHLYWKCTRKNDYLSFKK